MADSTSTVSPSNEWSSSILISRSTLSSRTFDAQHLMLSVWCSNLLTVVDRVCMSMTIDNKCKYLIRSCELVSLPWKYNQSCIHRTYAKKHSATMNIKNMNTPLSYVRILLFPISLCASPCLAFVFPQNRTNPSINNQIIQTLHRYSSSTFPTVPPPCLLPGKVESAESENCSLRVDASATTSVWDRTRNGPWR